MAKVLPNAQLKVDPHIKSKVKILKKLLSYILEIQQNGSGFGWDNENKMSRDGAAALYMKPMVNFEKLCEVYASDLAKGGNAKGLGEEEVVGGEPTTDEAHQNSEHISGGDEQTKDENNNPSTGKQELIKNLLGLDDDQVVMAIRIIGRDPEDTDLFLNMEDRYKVIFVKQELEAAKRN
uniref:Myb/SANT-like domain-containing protein n=1 Tax=Setaria viridis TaxID=4556 RepID=A0A4U6SYP7_SETVI|nr:hypothetical protein SEVIR_9G274400v2 [Setaria viridis]